MIIILFFIRIKIYVKIVIMSLKNFVICLKKQEERLMVNINFEVKNEELHRAFKIKCINHNKTFEEQLNELIEHWVEE